MRLIDVPPRDPVCRREQPRGQRILGLVALTDWVRTPVRATDVSASVLASARRFSERIELLVTQQLLPGRETANPSE
jgi:hypothetical protein